MLELPDIQSSGDERGIALGNVGVDAVRAPIHFIDGTRDVRTHAVCAMGVTLPASQRGTHMSRMVDLLHRMCDRFDPRDAERHLKEALGSLHADEARYSIDLPFPVDVVSPVTDRVFQDVIDVRCEAHASADGVIRTRAVARMGVTTLCPCSRAVSDYGAHNQRTLVTFTVDGTAADPYPWPFDEMAAVISASGSCSLHPYLKRQDERFVTMRAFDRPKFVEDVARDLALEAMGRGLRHHVHVRSLESIHSHDAVAESCS